MPGANVLYMTHGLELPLLGPGPLGLARRRGLFKARRAPVHGLELAVVAPAARVALVVRVDGDDVVQVVGREYRKSPGRCTTSCAGIEGNKGNSSQDSGFDQSTAECRPEGWFFANKYMAQVWSGSTRTYLLRP